MVCGHGGGPGGDHVHGPKSPRVKGELDVVHIVSEDAVAPGAKIQTLKELATDLGARWHEVHGHDPARTLLEFARQHQITQLVIGSSKRSRWQELTGGGSIVRRVIREAGSVGIDVQVIARRDLPSSEDGEGESGEWSD